MPNLEAVIDTYYKILKVYALIAFGYHVVLLGVQLVLLLIGGHVDRLFIRVSDFLLISVIMMVSIFAMLVFYAADCQDP